MKMIMKWILMMVCCAYASIAHADCEECGGSEIVSLEQKFYVHPAQICFAEDAIYIDANGIVYETPAVYLDESGYYIDRVKQASCSWYEWKC